MPRRYDIAPLAKAEKLPNGFLRAEANLTRTGIFTYRNPDGTERRELRLASEVFDAGAVKSFEMAPVTDDHPHEMLDAGNVKLFQRGHLGDSLQRDGDKLRGSLLVTDPVLISKMDAGKTQVSCGYHCDVDPTPGVWQGQPYDAVQRNIRGNHVAVVERGRAGEGCHVRMDDAFMVEPTPHEDAEFTAKHKNDLPDSAFLYVEPGEKDEDGKTTPRSKRHFPVKNASGEVDLPHVRNALARIPQSDVPAAAKAKALAKARTLLKAHGGEPEKKKDMAATEEKNDSPMTIEKKGAPSKKMEMPPIANKEPDEDDEYDASSGPGGGGTGDEDDEDDEDAAEQTVAAKHAPVEPATVEKPMPAPDGIKEGGPGNPVAKHKAMKPWTVTSPSTETGGLTSKTDSVEVDGVTLTGSPESIQKFQARLDAAAFQKAVSARVALEKSAAKFLGEKRLDAMSDRDVKLAALDARGIKVDLKCSDDYLAARYDAMVDAVGADALASFRANASGGDRADDARLDAKAAESAYRKNLGDLWRTPTKQSMTRNDVMKGKK